MTNEIQNSTVVSRWVATSLERVWQTITDAKQLEEWFAPGCTWEIEDQRCDDFVTVRAYAESLAHRV